MEVIRDASSFMLQVVPDEEFLNNNLNNKDAYVDCDAAEDILDNACSLRQYGWRFDSTELKDVSKILKIKY